MKYLFIALSIVAAVAVFVFFVRKTKAPQASQKNNEADVYIKVKPDFQTEGATAEILINQNIRQTLRVNPQTNTSGKIDDTYSYKVETPSAVIGLGVLDATTTITVFAGSNQVIKVQKIINWTKQTVS